MHREVIELEDVFGTVRVEVMHREVVELEGCIGKWKWQFCLQK